MDTLRFSCLTPQLSRLVTFHETPFPNARKMSISNSPAKFAQAGFLRRIDAKHDEVSCGHCGITYGNWEGESPFIVHWIINECCPFLSTPSPEIAVESHPTVLEARRRLFPYDSDSGDPTNDSGYDSRLEDSTSSSTPPFVSLLSSETSFTFPYHPKVGDYPMLFASRRLKTFSNPRCTACVKWAEEGFVYRPDADDVQCVFCAVVLPFAPFGMQQKHADNSALCPRVLMKDVGNITIEDEKRIRPKFLRQQLQRMKSHPSYIICHPQYEDADTRRGTFENWPPQLAANGLDPIKLSQAGFYFTVPGTYYGEMHDRLRDYVRKPRMHGTELWHRKTYEIVNSSRCSDKVKCYCCGLGLHSWLSGSDPWEQHALHRPSCHHLQAKGEHFIQQAALAQVLTETDRSSSTNLKASASVMGQAVTSPVGSLTMDMSAVTAALSTSRFPTQDILLGQLRANDLNFADLCRQREAIHQRDTELQQRDTELQQRDTELQQRDTELQQRDTELQQRDTELQHTHTELQHTHTELQHTHTELQHTHTELQHTHTELQHTHTELQQRDTELRVHREVVRTQEEELHRKEEEIQLRQRQIAYQEQQISSLQLQVQSLLAYRRQQMAQQQQQQQGQQAAPNQAADANPNAIAAAVVVPPVPNNSTTPMTCDIRCKVCLSAESNTIFQPCHHITCCKNCAQRLINEVCPVCRTPISKVLPAYIS